jgi:hypothetical protein
MTAPLDQLDSWLSWIDDLPLPEGFNAGQDALQDFVVAAIAAITLCCLFFLFTSCAKNDAERIRMMHSECIASGGAFLSREGTTVCMFSKVEQ